MKKFCVYNNLNKEIGYLMLDTQLYYAHTLEGKRLPKAYFQKENAEKCLNEFVTKPVTLQNIDMQWTPQP